jgi:tRNA threonylcarbamoyladenosine biosynthesis protein TsaE
MRDTFETTGEAETVAAGARLGRTLGGGELVLLHGQLGAGKTAFVKGLAESAGIPADEVSSPTFTLIQEYAGDRFTVYHVDLYRLAPREVPDLGLDELVGGRGVVAIEWPDRWEDRPDRAIDVTIEEAGEDRRRITVARDPV